MEKLESGKTSALKWVPSTPSEVHACGFRYYQRVTPEVLFLLLFSSRTCLLLLLGLGFLTGEMVAIIRWLLGLNETIQ